MSQTWVVLNDIQIPFQDRKVLSLVLSFVGDLNPDGVVLNGDITDCYPISDFVRSPGSHSDIMVEVRESQKLMTSLKDVPKKIWVGGNHEDRMRRYQWKRIPELAEHPNLTFDALFHMADYGFSWLEYGESVQLGKLMVTHGHLVSKHSAWSGKMTLEQYGTSVMVGHTHRLGVHYKRDIRGVHGAWENGCLCRLDPEYVRHPNWQQGFSVVHVEPNGFYSVQQIPILPGPSFMYGKDRIR